MRIKFESEAYIHIFTCTIHLFSNNPYTLFTPIFLDQKSPKYFYLTIARSLGSQCVDEEDEELLPESKTGVPGLFSHSNLFDAGSKIFF